MCPVLRDERREVVSGCLLMNGTLWVLEDYVYFLYEGHPRAWPKQFLEVLLSGMMLPPSQQS